MRAADFPSCAVRDSRDRRVRREWLTNENGLDVERRVLSGRVDYSRASAAMLQASARSTLLSRCACDVTLWSSSIFAAGQGHPRGDLHREEADDLYLNETVLPREIVSTCRT